jgi:predicted NAD/FAD-binding protein
MKELFLIIVLFFPLSLLARQKVAIIGGGMGGVSTATFLKNSNFDIHLFEKEDRLGGHATTVTLPGKNYKRVEVDIGPQYLAKGGWDLYFDFLRHLNIYDEKNYYQFKSTITVYKEGQEYPEFTSDQPAEINISWMQNVKNPIFRLTSMAQFMSELFNFNQRKLSENISVGDYLDKTSIKKEYLENIIKPLVATALTSPRNMVDNVSMISTAGVLGFRRALDIPMWMVPKSGMQAYIQQVAQISQNAIKNFQIHLSSPVTKVIRNNDGTFKVFYGDNKEMQFDKVVLAVHVPVLKEIIGDWEKYSNLWGRFPYTYNKVLILNDPEYLHPVYQSFYNVKIQNDGTTSMGMKLSTISPDFGNLVKAWGFTDEKYKELKEKGHILAERDFMHPLPTIGFIDALKELRELEGEEENIAFAGGWSQNWETQYNAILSGYNAATKLDPKAANFWKGKLRSLKMLKQ